MVNGEWRMSDGQGKLRIPTKNVSQEINAASYKYIFILHFLIHKKKKKKVKKIKSACVHARAE